MVSKSLSEGYVHIRLGNFPFYDVYVREPKGNNLQVSHKLISAVLMNVAETMGVVRPTLTNGRIYQRDSTRHGSPVSRAPNEKDVVRKLAKIGYSDDAYRRNAEEKKKQKKERKKGRGDRKG